MVETSAWTWTSKVLYGSEPWAIIATLTVDPIAPPKVCGRDGHAVAPAFATQTTPVAGWACRAMNGLAKSARRSTGSDLNIFLLCTKCTFLAELSASVHIRFLRLRPAPYSHNIPEDAEDSPSIPRISRPNGPESLRLGSTADKTRHYYKTQFIWPVSGIAW